MLEFVIDNGDDPRETITLKAEDQGTPWNGYAVPHATAAQFRNYVTAMAQIDPNGEWAYMTINEVSDGHDSVLYSWRASEDREDGDRWASAGVASDGATPVYALDGWVWLPATV